MDLPRVEPRPRLEQLGAERHAGRARAQVVPAGADKDNDAGSFADAVAPSVEVQVRDRESGVRTVTVLDRRTGQTVLQTPPDAVVHAVERALWQIRHGRQKEGAGQ